MKALVYHGPGRHSWEDVDKPGLRMPDDAIVRIDTVTICGTDLHILKGDVADVTPERVLGHEAVGTVEQVGSGVRDIAVGDRVLVSCISPCGRCRYCRAASYGQCRNGGGWILGHLVDGTQAEYVRAPFADNSLHVLPDGVTDEAALLLADILPTAYEVGVLNGRVLPGDTVAIVGAGPIGLATIMTARLFSPSRIIVVDAAQQRLDAAKQLGADVTVLAADDPRSVVAELTGGLGVDVAIEAVGIAETFELCADLVRPGGHLANIGVHGKPATLHLETLWIKNITITTGLVDAHSTPTLLKMLASGQLDTSRLVTHRFGIGEMLEAYDVFAQASDTGALKVALFRT
ncbi:MAG: alcohol dehydrogenase [Pseudonocardiales bacterium]|jgi:alcohol dehydrogenase|nr:alcohol dehydrogenase [Pseudonocardiales bacterium]